MEHVPPGNLDFKSVTGSALRTKWAATIIHSPSNQVLRPEDTASAIGETLNKLSGGGWTVADVREMKLGILILAFRHEKQE